MIQYTSRAAGVVFDAICEVTWVQLPDASVGAVVGLLAALILLVNAFSRNSISPHGHGPGHKSARPGVPSISPPHAPFEAIAKSCSDPRLPQGPVIPLPLTREDVQ